MHKILRTQMNIFYTAYIARVMLRRSKEYPSIVPISIRKYVYVLWFYVYNQSNLVFTPPYMKILSQKYVIDKYLEQLPSHSVNT